MSAPHEPLNIREGPGRYQIRVKENLDARWAARFEGLSLSHEQGGTTLSGLLLDQAALHGVLRKVRDSGLTLVAVVWVACTEAEPVGLDADQNHPHSGP